MSKLGLSRDVMKCIQMNGFEFSFDPNACKSCQGLCCRGTSGHVWVDHQEIEALSAFLNSNAIDVMERYLRRIDNRYALKERYDADGFACIFYDTVANRCEIYDVRPFQCRQFPFWDYFKHHPEVLIEECPGVKPQTAGGRTAD